MSKRQYHPRRRHASNKNTLIAPSRPPEGARPHGYYRRYRRGRGDGKRGSTPRDDKTISPLMGLKRQRAAGPLRDVRQEDLPHIPKHPVLQLDREPEISGPYEEEMKPERVLVVDPLLQPRPWILIRRDIRLVHLSWRQRRASRSARGHRRHSPWLSLRGCRRILRNSSHGNTVSRLVLSSRGFIRRRLRRKARDHNGSRIPMPRCRCRHRCRLRRRHSAGRRLPHCFRAILVPLSCGSIPGLIPPPKVGVRTLRRSGFRGLIRLASNGEALRCQFPPSFKRR